MVDLTAKPFHLDDGGGGLGAEHHRRDDARGEDRPALHQPQRRVHARLPRPCSRHLPCRRDALPGCGRRDGAGAHPLRAVEVEAPAAHRLEPRDGRLREHRRRHAGLLPTCRPARTPTRRSPATWVASPGSRPPRSAATGPSRRSSTSTATGATRSSPPARSATRPRWSSSARRRTSTASASRGPPARSSISPATAWTSATSTSSRRGTRSAWMTWDASYGRVYRAMIDHGVQSIMAGHIGAPAAVAQVPPRHRRPRPPAGHPGPRAAAGPAARRTRLQRPHRHRCLADGRPDLGDAASRPGAGRDRRGLRHVPLLPQCRRGLQLHARRLPQRGDHRGAPAGSARAHPGAEGRPRPAHDAARGARPRPGSAGRRRAAPRTAPSRRPSPTRP